MVSLVMASRLSILISGEYRDCRKTLSVSIALSLGGPLALFEPELAGDDFERVCSSRMVAGALRAVLLRARESELPSTPRLAGCEVGVR